MLKAHQDWNKYRKREAAGTIVDIKVTKTLVVIRSSSSLSDTQLVFYTNKIY